MSGKSNAGKTVFTLIIVAVCGYLLFVYWPQIAPFVKEKFGSKESIKKMAEDVGKNVDKANEQIEKGLNKAGSEVGKGIDSLRR